MNKNSKLHPIGWNPFFEAQYQLKKQELEGMEIGRVAIREGIACQILTPNLITVGIGKASFGYNDKMVTGDWIAFDPVNSLINFVFDRKSEILRKVAGERTMPQPLAANVDTIFITTAIGEDLNLGRIERYLATVWSTDAEPVILVTKTDLPHDRDALHQSLKEIAPGVLILFTSIKEGPETILNEIKAGQTAVLIGSSGVGKSTLVNRLANTELKIGDVREKDQKGRHTTTQRILIRLPNGGLIIDTPGIRELSLWDAQQGLDRLFEDVREATEHCKFRDCKHEREPGCGILSAIEAGTLSRERVERHRKLVKENAYFEDPIEVRKQQKVESKRIAKALRKRPK